MNSCATAIRSAIRQATWLEGCLIASMGLLAVQLLPEAWRMWSELPRAGHHIPAQTVLASSAPAEVCVRYWVYLPREYSTRTQWPLLLYLHGSGERGEDLQKVLHSGLPALIASGRHFPMIVVSPQCRARRGWDVQILGALLDHLETRFAVNPARLYIAGFSMGGFGTWSLASASPERFAAAVPVAGGGNTEHVERLVDLPIWAFHGQNDTVVPTSHSVDMIASLCAAGGTPKLTVIDNAGHGIDRQVFSNPELYSWLLQQSRAAHNDVSPSQ